MPADDHDPGHCEAEPIEGEEGQVGPVAVLERQERLSEGKVDQHATEGPDGTGESDQRPRPAVATASTAARSRPEPTSSWALAWKMAGIIL